MRSLPKKWPNAQGAAAPRLPFEIWGGLEATVNRVQDRYFSQMDRNGHLGRVSDLDLFASLGIRALRYPVLWELLQPEPDKPIDWSWADERLGRLRELGIRPIVGLVHHGSGPRYTSLVDSEFAAKLADFARKVAERYPWVTEYTPVNEPLTTARFSGLYGLWYPHGRDQWTFVRAIINECRAIAQSMSAIREINPNAQLIQTDDLGRIYFTPPVENQAKHYADRRWLTFDLLCGCVNPDHPLYWYLVSGGATEEELREFVERPCPPDVIGVNHYLTSDRFLDHEIFRYPEWMHAFPYNEPPYVDVEAVRVCPECPVDPKGVLREAWERYHIPVAITEAHIGCTREEQIRWLAEVTEGARELRREGIPVRAVTSWSLLGAYNWNTLVTCDGDFYEPGAFDVRAPKPRPTALARIVRTLAAGEPLRDPVLDAPGWWRRPERFTYPHASGRAHAKPPTKPQQDMEDRSLRPLLIVGATGSLAQCFARLCDVRGIPYHVLGPKHINLLEPRSVDAALDTLTPWAVVNASEFSRVDEAERDQEQCFRINSTNVALLAAACARHGIPMLAFSSDLVFDGRMDRPYRESDSPHPLSVYGQSKAEMEERVLNILPSALVVRTSSQFGPWDRHNFLTLGLAKLARGERWALAEDVVTSPTYLVDLVHAALDLLIDGECGLWHLVNAGRISWAEFGRRAATVAGLPEHRLDYRRATTLGWMAPRPANSALESERGWVMPSLDEAIDRYWAEVRSTFEKVHAHAAAQGAGDSEQLLAG